MERDKTRLIALEDLWSRMRWNLPERKSTREKLLDRAIRKVLEDQAPGRERECLEIWSRGGLAFETAVVYIKAYYRIEVQIFSNWDTQDG